MGRGVKVCIADTVACVPAVSFCKFTSRKAGRNKGLRNCFPVGDGNLVSEPSRFGRELLREAKRKAEPDPAFAEDLCPWACRDANSCNSLRRAALHSPFRLSHA